MVILRVMAIPVGSLEAHFNFSCTGVDHGISFGIGIVDLDLLDPRTPLELAELMLENWTAAGRPFESSNMATVFNLEDITVIEYTVDGPVGHVTSTGEIGTGAQEAPPINCALLVTKKTALAGRRNTGRCYMPVFLPGESQIDASGRMSSITRSTIQSQISAAQGADVADDIGYLLYHQSGADTPTAITELVLGAQLATQRRRMRG